MSKKFLPFLILFLVFSCAKTKEKKEEIINAESEYLKAYKLLKEKDYHQAAEVFEKIDDEYPFSKWASKAQVMAVYAYYKDEDSTKLIQIIDDFIKLNPSSEYVPYMLYMKGISYYDKIPEIEIAQDNSRDASFTFRELIARFPNSQYATDAKEKIPYIDEHLAGAKMSIGRNEIKNGNYVGAIVNFVEVVNRYRQTNQVPEAYFRLIEIYYRIGLKEEGQSALEQIKSRFPNNNWTKIAIKEFDKNVK